MKIRILNRKEIEKVKDIDRSERVHEVYYLKDGQLTLKDECYDIKNWDRSELDDYIMHLYDIYDRHGTLFGAFNGLQMIAVSALESEFIGANKDQLQLYFHYVSHHHRHKGIGGTLLMQVAKKAQKLGATKLYISATPSKNTINFYMHMGCRRASVLNAELYELEPEDIHLELTLARYASVNP